MLPVPHAEARWSSPRTVKEGSPMWPVYYPHGGQRPSPPQKGCSVGLCSPTGIPFSCGLQLKTFHSGEQGESDSVSPWLQGGQAIGSRKASPRLSFELSPGTKHYCLCPVVCDLRSQLTRPKPPPHCTAGVTPILIICNMRTHSGGSMFLGWGGGVVRKMLAAVTDNLPKYSSLPPWKIIYH